MCIRDRLYWFSFDCWLDHSCQHNADRMDVDVIRVYFSSKSDVWFNTSSSRVTPVYVGFPINKRLEFLEQVFPGQMPLRSPANSIEAMQGEVVISMALLDCVACLCNSFQSTCNSFQSTHTSDPDTYCLTRFRIEPRLMAELTLWHSAHCGLFAVTSL